MTEHVDTIIVGGGQAGLSTSYYLKKQGREHVILEQAQQAAKVWRNRWDSFTLNTPNWMTRLPGAEYQGNDPDGFMPRDEIVAYFDAYIERFELPIRYGIQVTSVEAIEAGYLVSTDNGEFRSCQRGDRSGLTPATQDTIIQHQPASGDPPTSFQRISKSRNVTRRCGACRRIGTIRLPDC